MLRHLFPELERKAIKRNFSVPDGSELALLLGSNINYYHFSFKGASKSSNF